MTYEEYKNSKKSKKPYSFIKKLINKFLIVLILVLCVLITCNYSEDFRNFVNEKILGDTFDFSKINKFINSFKVNDAPSETVMGQVEKTESEKYLDGLKYNVNLGDEVVLRESGIVTFIGEKEGYNNVVIIQQSNGYYAWYGNVKEEVKLYDYLTKGTVIGTSASSEYFYALFKDGQAIEINEN